MFLARLASLWRNLRHRDRAERDLDQEVTSYAALLEDEKVAHGMRPEEAKRAALVEVGGLEQLKEDVRRVRMGAWIETFWRDVRYGIRSLARTPAFTAAAVVALALGIGATTAIFSVVDAVLLRPLPYHDPDRLAVVLHGGRNPVSPANFLDWQRQASTFERMGAAEYWAPNLTGPERPERTLAVRLTSAVLPLLGVRPLLGRVLATEAERVGEREVVLGYRLWQRRYAGDAGVIGRPITLDGETHTVVGVMPRGFEFPPFWALGAELWAPLPLADRPASRNARSLRVFARLRPGVSLDEARAEVATVTARLDQQAPGTNRDVEVRALGEMVVGNVRSALLVLLGSVGFMLLIACANVAHMLLARATARQKEMALRAALGATRARIVRQLLTESVLLALMGGAAGLVLASAVLRVLVAIGPSGLHRLDTAALDGRVLAATMAVSLLTGILFGLAPALQASRRDLTGCLREGERSGTAGLARQRLRRLLMGSELALSLVLLVGAGLMIRTFVALRAVDPGFEARHVLTAVVSTTGSGASAPGRRVAFFRQVLEEARRLPGVVSASAANHLPLGGDTWGRSFHVEGRPLPAPGEGRSAIYRVALPGYFRTMGLPLLRGRDFGDTDHLGAPGVVIVNHRLAERHWPGEDPIGKRITLDNPSEDPEWLTVVGVSGNAVTEDWVAPAQWEVYLPYLQRRSYLEEPHSHYAYLTVVVRTTGDPALVAPALRSAIWSVDGNVAISSVRTMDEVVRRATSSPRFYLLLLATFAGVALALAAVGVYGVTSYSVARRRSEIGIRMALGARPADLLRMIVGEALVVAGAGAAVGLAAALALTRVMASLLYGVEPADPVTFAAVPVVLAVVALAATYVPARRATRIDPLAALRSE
jgi:predicted permease